MVTGLSAGRCIQPEASCGSARCRGPGGAVCRRLVPSLGARSRVCVDGSSPLLGPRAAYASMTRPPLGARSRVCVDGSSPLLGPGAAYASMARHPLGARSSVFVDGSSRHPGPEPYRPQRPVPLLRARGRVDRLGSSRASRARSRLGRTGSSRPPGPEPYGDRPLLRWALGLRMFGPYFALGRDLATFALGEVPMTGRPLLRGAATPRRLVPLTWGPEPCQGPPTFAPGT